MFRTLLSVLVLVGFVGVPVAIAVQVKPVAPAAAKAAGAGPINLNAASAADLQRLPGIGAKTADRIIEYRQKNGAFKKIEELMNVRGVGEKAFLKLRAQITVSVPPKTAASTQP